MAMVVVAALVPLRAGADEVPVKGTGKGIWHNSEGTACKSAEYNCTLDAGDTCKKAGGNYSNKPVFGTCYFNTRMNGTLKEYEGRVGCTKTCHMPKRKK